MDGAPFGSRLIPADPFGSLRAGSLFFSLEMVGSSLLFVYDDDEASAFTPSVWMIDFAKSIDHRMAEPDDAAEPPLPKRSAEADEAELPKRSLTKRSASSGGTGAKLTHRDDWEAGNHEDGYLRGLDTLIELWESNGQ